MTQEEYNKTKQEILKTNDAIIEAYLYRNYKRMDLLRIYMNHLIDECLEREKIYN